MPTVKVSRELPSSEHSHSLPLPLDPHRGHRALNRIITPIARNICSSLMVPPPIFSSPFVPSPGRPTNRADASYQGSFGELFQLSRGKQSHLLIYFQDHRDGRTSLYPKADAIACLLPPGTRERLNALSGRGRLVAPGCFLSRPGPEP